MNPTPLTTLELDLLDRYWRAANYLSVGQIYLLDNPLLRQPLTSTHVKPRLIGHFGTTPGLNFLYAHCNRMIRQRDLDLLFITALLTIGGYSLTDTVVVFDRIRENIRLRKKGTFSEVINLSVNEVLSRTIVTSLTTFVAVVSLLAFGGIVLRDFALALAMGIVVGTYSSVFVASPVVALWRGEKMTEVKR